MAEVAVRYPQCQSDAVVKYGKTRNGKARLRGQQRAHWGRTFLQTYAYAGCLPTVKRRRVERTLKGSGIRDSARVLQVGANTVQKELKKSSKPLAGEHKRRRRGLSRRDHGRRARRGSGGGRGEVEFCAAQSAPTGVVACQ
jgi:transposase-like protein